MSLQGKIIYIFDDKKKAKVLVKPVADCNGCKACAGLLKANKNKLSEQEIEVINDDFDIKIGDIVKLELTEYQGSKAAIILYGIPIIGFIFGMLIAPFFCNLFQVDVTDIARVIGAFTGLGLSMLSILFYLRSKKSDSFMMHITSVINQ